MSTAPGRATGSTFAALACLTACNPGGTQGPADGNALVGFIVAQAGQAYASLRPGTVPAGVAAEIRNRSRSLTREVFLFAGGFDPVAVPAAAGEALELSVRGETGNSLLLGSGVVPPTRNPIVVRSNPAPGKSDVPLDATLVVVFSEPITPATVTGASIRVTGATGAVSGQVTLSGDGTRVEFVPAQALTPATAYTLALTSDITAASGGHLEPVSLAFTSAGTGPRPYMSQILYVGCMTQSPYGTCGLFVMNADGSSPRQLTEASSDNWDSHPAWSPGGGLIAFSSYRHCALTGRIPYYQQGSCKREIYTMHADGSGITRLTDRESVDQLAADYPAWSPDGSRIAFNKTSTTASHAFALATVRPDGSDLRTLLSSSQLVFGPSSWSPDGGRLVMTVTGCCLPSGDPAAFHGLHVVNADGSHFVPITSGFDVFPKWSPDGTRIAFHRQAGGSPATFHIFLVGPFGLNETQLTHGGTNYYLTPDWAPNGNRIVLKTIVGGISQIFVMNADGSGLALLNAGWANLPAWSRFGSVP